ncbi:MAG TPA: hypothetical protein VE954_18950 [Oligoflexus sp.]|uniref:hypothetical protein n=1 Tax=Oligoflexus sp. TaxID=1971216 RepID=UPI002D2F4FC9|nr:hypothetical protein [Oligoflexus sp.]HYX35179.1 hypothetical protein [Oligoflexus sp.]
MLTTIQACSKDSSLPGMTNPAPSRGSVNADTSLNSLDVIVSDMLAPHEGLMHGVPASYSWSAKPRVGMGNDAGSWTALTAWGQVYEAAEGSRAVNTRVALRNSAAYFLSKASKTWKRIQFSDDVEGAAYREDFSGDYNQPADIRREDDGSISVPVGHGFNFHFWPRGGRAPIDPNDIGGIFTTFQARLVLDDKTKPDDRQNARFLAGSGADYWLNPYSVWDDWKTNGDVGIGRMRFVESTWASYNMHSLTEQEVRDNPPPIEW